MDACAARRGRRRGEWRVFRRQWRLQLEAREALERLDHGGVILVPEAATDRRDENLAGVRGGRERHASLTDGVEAVLDVLEHVLRLEELRVVVRAHRPGFEIQDGAAGGPGGQDLDERVEVDVQRAAGDQSLARP